jgi:hypothetical protein
MRKVFISLCAAAALCGAAALAISPGQAQPARRLPNAGPPPAAEMNARRETACQDRYAAAVGRMASLEVRLKLTGAQTGAFNRWRDARLGAARRMSQACASRPVPARDAARPSPVERMARQEERLRQRLSDLQAERPAFEALYNSLSPEQRTQVARAARDGRRGMRGRMMGRLAMRDGMRGPGGPGMMRGPGGRGPGGRGAPPPDAPPPPM